MARVAIGVQSLAGSVNPASLNDITFTAGNANDHYWDLRDGDILVVRSTAGSNTVTLVSVADSQGRSGDSARAIASSGDFAIYGPLKADGWRQSNGNVHVDLSNTSFELAVLRA